MVNMCSVSGILEHTKPNPINIIPSRLGWFFCIPKNTCFFEEPVFRFYQILSTEKPKKPRKKLKNLQKTDIKMASQRTSVNSV